MDAGADEGTDRGSSVTGTEAGEVEGEERRASTG